MMVLVVILGLVGAGYFVIFRIATVSHDPADWHIDPLVAPASPTPNDFRMAPDGATRQRVDAVAPVYSVRPLVLAQAFDDFALSQRATARIAGLPPELMMTYVQRSPKLKIPDYLTVKFIALSDTTSTIAVYSRARFGYGDLGVNEARVRQWVGALDSFLVSAQVVQ